MTQTNFLQKLNKEKQDIINTEGNVLVIANPGTGKTFLLAYKYVQLIKKGIEPDEILCLTFTEKAKKELGTRITKILNETNTKIDFSKLLVHTFHSYANSQLVEQDVISSNLLRYAIFRFLKDNEILNYGDAYLIEDIVPRMENLIRYLKTFGITVDKIDLNKVKSLLKEGKSYTKEEIDIFAEHFVNIYKHYEQIKEGIGIDYSDMLNNFLKIKDLPKFKYVLVDELQDVNKTEADMALNSAEHFIAVGDKKQAIFGFQGGSIINFNKFKTKNQKVLSENFRSSNEVLEYSKNYFINKTKDESHKVDLKDLRSEKNLSTQKPIIYDVEKDKSNIAVAELIKKLSKENKSIAVITRNNHQISLISKELKNRGIEHTTTFSSSSKNAKNTIITFLKGLFSNDPNIIRNALFTPFSPITLQEAFAIDDRAKLNELLKNQKIKELRDSVKNLEDLDRIFDKIILPTSVNYGKEYFLSAINIRNACKEAEEYLNEKSYKNFIDYLLSSDMLADEPEKNNKIVISTVHKAKGLEFDDVIYLPSKPKDNSNFQDEIVEAILKTHNINAEEELEEETLRIDFVAFTRAKEKLFIITDKPEEYITPDANQEILEIDGVDNFKYTERHKRAYNLFVQGDYDKAKELIKSENKWIIEYVKSFFENLDRISYSYLKNDAFEYLTSCILSFKDFAPELNFGSIVHEIAEAMCKNEKYEETEELKPFIENIKIILKGVREKYPELHNAEEEIIIPIDKMTETKQKIVFKAKIDAIFKNNKGEYMILDWKTDKNNRYASEHKQQLEAYKRAFSVKHNIPLDKIEVSVGFVGIRSNINTGRIEAIYDNKKPTKTAFETFEKRLIRFLSWKEDTTSFFKDIIELDCTEDPLWRAVVEQYNEENENHNN